MRVHFVGVAGTFMASLAILAKKINFSVSGSDEKIYPPMSDELAAHNIRVIEDYNNPIPDADSYVIGNALSRGNPQVETILEQNLPFTSGAEWLAHHVLRHKWVVAIAGTHGKTTVTSMVSWILECAGQNPSFLIGGVSKNFNCSVRLTNSKYFVIEADEYDTAFFDKRAKFVHFRPRTLLLNNLEFDHADIYNSLADIERQFHHLVRTVPSNGAIVYPDYDPALKRVIKMGAWSKLETLPKARYLNQNGCKKPIMQDESVLSWSLIGEHNAANAIAACAVAKELGVPLKVSREALGTFWGVKRRLDTYYSGNKVTLYDDFAHHPSAIRSTLRGLRENYKKAILTAVLDLRSNTMRMGTHRRELVSALTCADFVFVYQSSEVRWKVQEAFAKQSNVFVLTDTEAIIQHPTIIKSNHIVVMSNAGFEGIVERLKQKLIACDA